LNTITDFAKGDKLVLGSTVSDLVNGTTAVASATTLAGALDAALKIATDVVQNDSVWFVYGGNTYIALEDGTDGLTNGDVVVKLAGVYDLATAASLASNVITGL
jgi:xanthine dehydrogenase iron-sulfur cluster and FAD-binding subunit A